MNTGRRCLTKRFWMQNLTGKLSNHNDFTELEGYNSLGKLKIDTKLFASLYFGYLNN